MGIRIYVSTYIRTVDTKTNPTLDGLKRIKAILDNYYKFTIDKEGSVSAVKAFDKGFIIKQ